MEEKLAAYRARKHKEFQAQQSLLGRLFHRQPSKVAAAEDNTLISKDKPTSLEAEGVGEGETTVGRQAASSSPAEEPSDSTLFAERSVSPSRRYLELVLKILLWCFLWAFFIDLQFGAVYFIVSVLVLMYRNTGTGPRGNRLSAYSVFNRNQERLDGTFTAEQFEKELRFGAGSVK